VRVIYWLAENLLAAQDSAHVFGVSVAIVIQHARRMRFVVLPFVLCLDVPYFSTLSRKWYNFPENVIEYKMCVLIFSPTLI